MGAATAGVGLDVPQAPKSNMANAKYIICAKCLCFIAFSIMLQFLVACFRKWD